MTSITPGTNGTLKSTTAEALLAEIATFLRNNEKVSARNPTNLNYIRPDFNLNSFTFICSFSLPVEQTIGTDGGVTFTASEYLSGLTFSAGAGGTFKSATAAQYFLEIIAFLQATEADNTKNPQANNYVSSSYDGDNNLFTGSVTIPLTASLVDGKPVINISEYLL